MRLSDQGLRNLCRAYYYDIRQEATILFAIRGALPRLCLARQAPDAGTPQPQPQLIGTSANYRSPRCTVGIWWTRSGDIALFPGSTVPSLPYLHQFPNSVAYFNVLLPGKYTLERGVHPRAAGAFQRHEALIMPGEGWVYRPIVIRETNRSRFSKQEGSYFITFPGDNLHASRREPGEVTNYADYLRKPFSSSGCITIAGQPPEYVTRTTTGFFWNSWQQFWELLDAGRSSDSPFPLLLFNYRDLHHCTAGKPSGTLRYGSSGDEVREIQQQLANIYSGRLYRAYYSGPLDGKLEAKTARAYLEFLRDYSPRAGGSEISLADFDSKTAHFVFTPKQPNHVIN